MRCRTEERAGDDEGRDLDAGRREAGGRSSVSWSRAGAMVGIVQGRGGRVERGVDRGGCLSGKM